MRVVNYSEARNNLKSLLDTPIQKISAIKKTIKRKVKDDKVELNQIHHTEILQKTMPNYKIWHKKVNDWYQYILVCCSSLLLKNIPKEVLK